MRKSFLKLLGIGIVSTPFFAQNPAVAQQRALGIDVSAWQGNMSQTTWNNLHSTDSRDFVLIRSSRGGTTGYYNQNDSDNSDGNNTLSQRYDDPYFVQNINRATAAGMFAGAYHFTRPDIVAGTQNSGGIANSGTDEANHFIQMAGAWMRPGYLVPMHDLEAGDGIRTDNEMAQFCIDFSERIYQVMGIRPGIYLNGNYAAFILQTASASLRDQIAQPAPYSPTVISPDYPILWSARWPSGSGKVYTGNIQTDQPDSSYAAIYGPWDDYGTTRPWKFWQYSSGELLQSFGSRLDADVANGGTEFLKDCLIPALWMNDSSGNWSTLTNWNSGKTPVAPVTGPGQVAPVGTQTLPTPRLPGASGSGVTSGQNDTVILERPNTNITVTLSSGAYNIRKLYARETLNISGGILTINYIPSEDSTPLSAQFSAPVTLSSSGSLSVHTLQVDATNTFALNGGTLTFNTISLIPNNASPGTLSVGGNVILNPLSNAAARITKGSGAASSGSINFNGANRTLTIGNGTNDVDVALDLPISNGALTKSGTGTLCLNTNSGYSGGTTISAGTLLVNSVSGSGTGTGAVIVNAGTLGGTGIVSGTVTVNGSGTIAPGTASSIGRLTLNSPPTLLGTTRLRINRNGGSSLADKLACSSGTLNFGGTLVVSNVGATLVGGEIFTNFSANAFSGSFATTTLPSLNSGLNWYLGNLTVNGTIKVNRGPSANSVSVTNIFPGVLQIPISSLTSGTDPDGDALSIASINLLTTNGVTLTTNENFIFYSNVVNAADRFTFTLSDGHGGTATGTAQIVPSAIGQFIGSPGVGATSFTLHLAGRPDFVYYVDRATNLPPIWLPISTNTAPANGLFDFIDSFPGFAEPPNSAFYRLRW